jgi:hypothetical protein
MNLVPRARALVEIFKAATTYFAIVFGFGFVFGTIRVFSIAPRFGERVAELIEMPLMLIAIVFGALVIKRFCAGRTLVAVGSGVVALGLLVLAELEFVMRLRGLSLSQYIASRDPVSGIVYLVMLVIFALMPWLVARSTRDLG